MTGTSKISMDTFGRFCKQFAACIQKTEEFVQEYGATAYIKLMTGAVIRSSEVSSQ